MGFIAGSSHVGSLIPTRAARDSRTRVGGAAHSWSGLSHGEEEPTARNVVLHMLHLGWRRSSIRLGHKDPRKLSVAKLAGTAPEAREQKLDAIVLRERRRHFALWSFTGMAPG